MIIFNASQNLSYFNNQPAVFCAKSLVPTSCGSDSLLLWTDQAALDRLTKALRHWGIRQAPESLGWRLIAVMSNLRLWSSDMKWKSQEMMLSSLVIVYYILILCLEFNHHRRCFGISWFSFNCCETDKTKKWRFDIKGLIHSTSYIVILSEKLEPAAFGCCCCCCRYCCWHYMLLFVMLWFEMINVNGR